MPYNISINTDTKEGQLLIIAIHALTISKEIILDEKKLDGTTKTFEEIYSIIERINNNYVATHN